MKQIYFQTEKNAENKESILLDVKRLRLRINRNINKKTTSINLSLITDIFIEEAHADLLRKVKGWETNPPLHSDRAYFIGKSNDYNFSKSLALSSKNADLNIMDFMLENTADYKNIDFYKKSISPEIINLVHEEETIINKKENGSYEVYTLKYIDLNELKIETDYLSYRHKLDLNKTILEKFKKVNKKSYYIATKKNDISKALPWEDEPVSNSITATGLNINDSEVIEPWENKQDLKQENILFDILRSIFGSTTTTTKEHTSVDCPPDGKACTTIKIKEVVKDDKKLNSAEPDKSKLYRIMGKSDLSYIKNSLSDEKAATWKNYKTKFEYSISSGETDFRDFNNTPCRHLNITASIEGKVITIHRTVCKDLNGLWDIADLYNPQLD